jgi:16S rRNA (guanine527-N7)-methyltransferase
VLAEAQRLGFIGASPLSLHIAHADAFVAAVDPPLAAVDLGSGGGLPALVLALAWPRSQWLLVEAMHKRAEFLQRAIAALHLTDRVEVLAQRSEIVGTDARRRGGADLVTARSFASPAVTAEGAAPFLRVGGRLVVAEPPDLDASWTRWPSEGLARAGLAAERMVRAGATVRVLCQVQPCPALLPRRAKRQQRSPLW